MQERRIDVCLKGDSLNSYQTTPIIHRLSYEVIQEFFQQLQDKLNGLDIEAEMYCLSDRIKTSAMKMGRVGARHLLRLYYVLSEGDLSETEKVKVYATLLSVLVSGNLIPQRIFGFLGIAGNRPES